MEHAHADGPASGRQAWLVYDGDCPVCKQYVQRLAARHTLPELALVDAREGGPLVEEVANLPHDINAGMVLKLDGRYHLGADAIAMLARISAADGAFARTNRALFRSRRTARWAYPLLACGRRLLLRLLRVPLIGERDGVPPR